MPRCSKPENCRCTHKRAFFMSISQSFHESEGYAEDFFSISENKYYTEAEVGDIFRNKNEGDLATITFNIESLPLHFDELEYTLGKMESKIDIIGITETKISDVVNAHYHPNLEGYTFYDTQSSTTKGGAGVFIHNSLSITERTDLDFSIPGLFETVWLDIETSSAHKKVVVGIIYRHPGYTDIPFFTRELEKTLSLLNRSESKYYLCGDFNVALQNIDDKANIEFFVNMMYSNYCVNMINKPTRFPRGAQPGGPSILDHFYTNHTETVKEIGIMLNDITDHRPIFAIIGEKSRRKDIKGDIYVRDYSNFDINAYNVSLSQFSYCVTDNLDTKITKLQTHIAKCVNDHIPLKKLTNKDKRFLGKPWISKSIKVSIERRKKLYRLSQVNHPNQRTRITTYNKYKKKLEKILFLAKSKFYRKKIAECKANSKALWRVINQITSRKKKAKTTIEKLTLSGNKVVTDPSSIANELNSFFVNVGPNLASKLPRSTQHYKSYLRNSPVESFILLPTNSEEVLANIKTFSNSNSLDPHNISSKNVKLGAESLSPIFTPFINECFAEGYFPKSLKIAKVTTI